MKKKLLSALLAAAMVVTAIPSAMAAKKDPTTSGGEKINIYPWGTFDSAEEVAKTTKTGSATISFQEGGAGGSKGCTKVEVKGTYGGIRIPAPFVVGETYDISFDLKADKAAAMNLIFQFSDGGWYYITRSGQFNNDWSKFKITWTNTGINTNNVQTSGAGQFEIRYGDGTQLETYYIDNFTCMPHGDVPADYSSVMGGSSNKPTQPSKPVVQEPVSVTQVNFEDMQNHWAKDTVNTLATYGYIEGIGNNQYAPNSDLTRAQFVKMITDTYHLTAPKYDGAFSDVKGDEWFASSVTIANKLGLLDTALTVGGTFKPDQAITREEAASIAAKAAVSKEAEKTAEVSGFTDDADITVWAKPAVKDAAEYGLIKGYDDGSYKPKNHITRAEAAQILMRVAEFSTKFNVYVDADNGNDNNDGTAEAPLKTIYAARDMIRKITDTMSNDIKVLIRGEHYLDRTFELTAEDSGNNGYSIIYTSWGDEKPVFSMGQKYKGFELHDASKNIYKVYVGKGTVTRQAYFNNVKGIRARSVAGLTNPEYIDKTYYTSEDTEFLSFAYPDELEFVYHVSWCNPRAIMESITDMGNGKVKFTPVQDEWKYVQVRVNTKLGQDQQFPSYVENAYELLDQEGEWYMNSHDGYMYYIPKANEDIRNVELTVPQGEVLLKATGKSAKEPVHNIKFNNIEFADTTWLRPTQVGGHADAQNNHIRENGDKMPGTAMLVENGQYIDFTNNKFTRMGITGLQLLKSIKHCNVIGNEFFDIAGTAVSLGGIQDGANPATPEEFNEYNKVNSNYVHNVATEYMSAAAISAAWPRYTELNHNEIVSVPYSGYHIGYGWASYADTGTAMYDLEVGYNYIHEVNNDRVYDGAPIYTLGASSLESKNLNNRMVGNYIENPRNPYGALYPDEGSTYWHLYNNVTDMSDIDQWEFNFVESPWGKDQYTWLHIHTGSIQHNTVENNYATTDKYRENGTDNIVRDNITVPDAEWPEEAQEIINNAGIEPEYAANFPDGPQSFVAKKRAYTLGKGETAKLDVKVTGRHQKEYPLSDFYTKFYSSDPSVLTVDDEGNMKVVGSGVVWVMGVAEVDGRLQTKQFQVFAGDDFDSIGINVNALNMIKDYTTTVSVTGKTTFGKDVTIPSESITMTSADETVATVAAGGKITAVGTGETTVHVKVTYGEKTLEKDIPVKVITYTQEDSLELPYEKAPSNFFTTAGWRGTGTVSGGSIKISGSPSFYTGSKLDNKLIAFDMQINNPNSWPSITFCAQDSMGSYKTDSTYMIGFKADHIELQRFNKGERTMIFGNDPAYTPVGGPGIPNPEDDPVYEYGKTCSVIVGALDTEEGTRVVLTINGENMFDFLDTDENALPASGYFGIYNPGDFTFSPYSGKTN